MTGDGYVEGGDMFKERVAAFIFADTHICSRFQESINLGHLRPAAVIGPVVFNATLLSFNV